MVVSRRKIRRLEDDDGIRYNSRLDAHAMHKVLFRFFLAACATKPQTPN